MSKEDKMELVLEYMNKQPCGTKLSVVSVLKELNINTNKMDLEEFYYELIKTLELDYGLLIDKEENDEPWKKRGILRHIYKLRDAVKPLSVDSFSIITNKLTMEEPSDDEPIEQRLRVEANGVVNFREYNYSGELNREISRNFDTDKIAELVSATYQSVSEHEDANDLVMDCGYFDLRFYVNDDIYEFSGSLNETELSKSVNALLNEYIGINNMWGI